MVKHYNFAKPIFQTLNKSIGSGNGDDSSLFEMTELYILCDKMKAYDLIKIIQIWVTFVYPPLFFTPLPHPVMCTRVYARARACAQTHTHTHQAIILSICSPCPY